VAQRKRVGLITQRSEDRNLVELDNFYLPAQSLSSFCFFVNESQTEISFSFPPIRSTKEEEREGGPVLSLDLDSNFRLPVGHPA
jgi:hypothetical protein